MCGFVISVSKDLRQFDGSVSGDIQLRGIDNYNSEVVKFDDRYLRFEFSHLFISSPETLQPLKSQSKILVLNGEIYNIQQLATRLEINSKNFNDVSILFQHIERFGLSKTISLANGMYSGFMFDKVTGECFVFTDHVGKKPLLIWNSSIGVHLGTGIDTSYVNSQTTNLNVVSPGIWSFDIKTGKVRRVYEHLCSISSRLTLIEALEDAISLRIPEDRQFAVALSGGLDSSIIASVIERKLFKKAHYFVVGDVYPQRVIELMSYLEIHPSRVTLIKLPKDEDLSDLIGSTCRVTKSYNPSIVSNGLATLLLSREVHKRGIRVLLSGEGADEFFCGYQGMYNGRSDTNQMRKDLVRDLHFTELRRLDLISASCSVEARCPFLDRRVTDIAMSTSVEELCDSQMKIGKIALREAFKNMLPYSIITAPKEPFDITSGLQKLVIDELQKLSSAERTALKSIFERQFNGSFIVDHYYFSHYPSFDTMIDRRDLKYKETKVK